MDIENLNTYHVIKEERVEDYNEFTAPNEVCRNTILYFFILFYFCKKSLFSMYIYFFFSILNPSYKILGLFSQFMICNISTVPHVCSKIE